MWNSSRAITNLYKNLILIKHKLQVTRNLIQVVVEQGPCSSILLTGCLIGPAGVVFVSGLLVVKVLHTLIVWLGVEALAGVVTISQNMLILYIGSQNNCKTALMLTYNILYVMGLNGWIIMSTSR